MLRNCNPTSIARTFSATIAVGIIWSLALGEPTQFNERSAPAHVESDDDNATAVGGAVVREGTHIRDRRGRFELTGDSAVFVADDGSQFGGLKNLNLQRVIQTLRASSDSNDVQWSVSGNVTEYLGRNFILITRVVRRSSSIEAAAVAN